MSLPLDRAATILDCLEHYASSQPEARAYTFVADGERDDRVLSYAELDRRSRRLAHHLVASGCHGRAVVLLFPSGLEFVVAFFACLRAGAIAVPANLTRNAQHFARLRLIIHDSGAAMVLTLADLKPSVENGLRLAGLEAGTANVVSEVDCCDDEAGIEAEALPVADPQALAFLQYTSGSTGAPKGVMVSHAQLIANTRAIRQAGNLPEHAEVGGWLPHFHDMGLIGTTLQPIALGGHYAFMAPLHARARALYDPEVSGRGAEKSPGEVEASRPY
jgi:acyl-CoA synthetase (AMP-forming)/AMP-acid ligase II